MGLGGGIGSLFVKIGADTSDLKSGLSESESLVSKTASAIGSLATVAAGAAVVGFGALAAGIGASVREAMDAQDSLAGLDAVLKSTGAAAAQQQAEYAKAAATTITTTKLSAAAIADLNQKINDSTLRYNTMSASIQEQRQRVIQLTQQWGENGLAVITAKNKLAEMENEQAKLGASIDTMKGKVADGSQVIKTTLAQSLGLVAGQAQMTREALLGLADSIQATTKFSDDMVIGAEKVLLTFRNVGKDVFPDAIKAATDMSTVMKQDLQSSIVQLGKALNDPVAGLTALSRVGVSFTKSQEDMIKKLVAQGKLVEAQKIILAELQAEFGGAAVAAGQTFSGQLVILQNQLANIMEQIGNQFLPLLQRLTGWLSTALASPVVQAAVAGIAAAFAELIAALTEGDIVGGVANFFTILSQGFGATEGQAIAFGDSMGGVIMALSQLANWVMTTGVPALMAFGAQVGVAFGPAFTALGDLINGVILPALVQLGAWFINEGLPTFLLFGGQFMTAMQPVFQGLGNLVAAILPILGTVVQKVVIPALTLFWQFVKTSLLPAIIDLTARLAPLVGTVLSDMGRLFADVIAPAVGRLAQWIGERLLPALFELAAAITNRIGPEMQKWIDQFVTPALNQFNGLVDAARQFLNWLLQIADALLQIRLPNWLQSHSPSPFENTLWNSAAAMQAINQTMPKAFAYTTASPIPTGDGATIGAAGGGGVTLNLTYSPVVSLADRAEAETQLKPFILAALRGAA